MIRFVVLSVILSSFVAGQSMGDDMTPLGLNYELRVLEDTQTLQVTMNIQNTKRRRTYVAMPNWTPGSYRPQKFGSWVSQVQALDPQTGMKIPVEQIDPLTWSIDTSENKDIKVTYVIEPRRRRFSPIAPKEGVTTTGMHYEGPATFMYVQGHQRGTPISCKYVLPQGWKVANGMMIGDNEMTRYVRDYDTFVDCPTIIGIFDRVEFSVNGTPFSCVFWNPQSKNNWDIKGFTNKIVKPIVTEEGRVFGSFPFPRYVFLFTVSPFGGGGLEHLSSTSIGLSSRGMANNIKSGASITAHEFFHTWNVKRIRPVALGPFNYRQENYTGNLWVSEGWTSYYGDITLARLGIISEESYLRQINGGITREMSNPNRQNHSVFWASRDIWHRGRVKDAGARVDYYTYGELMGLLIDLKIRHQSNNKKSLDDVMQFLNRWFAQRDVGFEEDDVERACTAISNYDFSDFFARHIYGTVPPPFAEYFSLAGIEYKQTNLKVGFPLIVRDHKNGLEVRAARSAGRRAGLKRGDIITKIDGKKVVDYVTYLSKIESPKTVALTVRSKGENKPKVIELDLVTKTRHISSLKPMKSMSRQQKAIYRGWMAKHL